MISAVDTSVLLDVLSDDPLHVESSLKLLERAYAEGGLILSDIVYAELSPNFPSRRELDEALAQLKLRCVCGSIDVAFLAGQKWAEYRRAGGTRARLLADFLIGAHALLNADRLLTRDRGFFRAYFPELTILEG